MKRTALLISLFALFFSACGKEEMRYTIPFAPVNYQLNLNNQDNALNSVLGFKTYTSKRLSSDLYGFSGLLVVNTGLKNSNGNNLVAYDLCCPKECQKNIMVSTTDGLKATCSKCGSVFNIQDGSGRPMSGPATNRLQGYQVVADGSNGTIYRVIN